MDAPNAAPFILIALAIAGHAFAYYFRTPKEENNALAGRVSNLESAHTSLALRFENSHARLDTTVENLEKSIDDLKVSIDKLTDKIGAQTKVRARART